MPKKTKNSFSSVHTPVCGVRGKKTSIGRGNVGFSSMNKTKKQNWKKIKSESRRYLMDELQSGRLLNHYSMEKGKFKL